MEFCVNRLGLMGSPKGLRSLPAGRGSCPPEGIGERSAGVALSRLVQMEALGLPIVASPEASRASA
jgi:hypothetical protein